MDDIARLPFWWRPLARFISRTINQAKESIMATNQERIDELATNLNRISTEIKAAIEDLKNQPPESLDFTRVDSAVGDLDDAAPPVDAEPPAGDGT